MKIVLSNHSSYAEVGQPNPLRWKTMFRDGDTFTDQSGWWKCKDFLNDTVAFFKEQTVFSIYGYKNNIKRNEEGVYCLLKYIDNRELFFKNLEVVNQQLKKDLDCVIAATPADNADEVMVLIPNPCWESTYRISMITMAIRLCNYGVEYKEWADLWKAGSPARSTEHAFNEDAFTNATKMGFKVPDSFNKFWWYAGPNYNSVKQPKQTGGMIHNNGVVSWSQGMKSA